MKIALSIATIMLAVFLAAAIAPGSQRDDLKAVYNLSGVLQGLDNKELTVTFSDDMLPLGGKRDGASLVRITPAVKGEFFWRGNRTLAFKPEPRFRFSTTYTAVIPAGVRSLAGKVLPKEIRWQWSTPQAYPVEIKAARQEYFSDLLPGKKLDFQVWVKDALTLRFAQPIAVAGAKDFFVLKEAQGGAKVQIRLIQIAGDAIEVRPAGDLKRGTRYEFIQKKDFHGSEGNTGTGREFSFTFDSVPAFRYAGKHALVLFPDAPYSWLQFANELAAFNENLISVFKVAGKEKFPLKFHIEPRYYGKESLFLNIDGELASGDRLRIRIDRNLGNIYGEPLPEDLEIEARVCSSRHPSIDFSMQNNKISLTTKSMKRADIRMFKLKPDFFTQLEKHGFGILQQKNFNAEFIEKELRQSLDDLPEKEKLHTLRDDELGSPLGFFGFLVTRYEPFNSCQDLGLLRRAAQTFPQFEVFHRRNMDMVIKAGKEQTLYWLYDNRSGKGLGQKPFFLHRSQDTGPLGEAAANGILIHNKGLIQGDLVIAKNSVANDMTLARIGQKPISDREVRITVFSDRDFYKPGDTVHIGGIIKEYASGRVSSPKTKSALLEIVGPDWQKVKSDTLQLDPLGGFHYEFKSDPSGKKGRYQIQVKVQDTQPWQDRHSVTIDYYQPNTFEISISGMAERYLPEDVFHPVVSGSYLAGNPMAGDGVSCGLALQPVASKVFNTMGLERHGFGLDRDLAQSDPPISAEKKLDGAGRHELAIPMSSFPRTNHLAGLHFSATGKTAEGKEFTSRAQSLYFPGNLVTGIRVGYYQNLKEQVKAELALLDFQGKPVSGEVRVTLYKEYYEKSGRKLKKVASPGDVFIEKAKVHVFRVSEAGHYILRCDTPDSKGRVVSTSSGFFAWDSNYSERENDLQIEAEQETLRIGEKLKCFIRSPREGRALVTVERGNVLDSRVIELQKMTALEIPIQKEHFPAIRVSVIAMYENNVSEEAERDFQVKDEGKTLHVGLESPDEIKPASKTKLIITVSDRQKIGVRAKLFVYAVDEGNLSLQGYRTPDPLSRFYYSNPLRTNAIWTYYSKHDSRWIFHRPMMDIDLPEPAIFGCVLRPDSTPLAGATVTLEDEKHIKLKTAAASPQGYYSFPGLPAGRYAVKAEARGFHPFFQADIYFSGRDHRSCDMALIPVAADKYWDPAMESELGGGVGGVGGVESGMAPAPMAAEMKSMARMKGEEAADSAGIGGIDVAGIRVRSNFKEVLFFKAVETDETGKATVDFESTDQLSTYRIMAVAYGEDSFGSAEKKIMVSKDLLISEAMPEFARQDDEFLAGVQLSNRTTQKLPFTLLAKPTGIAVRGAAQVKGALDPRGNGLFQFPFLADRSGEARVEFFALSSADKDGLEKKLFISDRLVRETLLDFASGKTVKKMIEPQSGVENQFVSIKVAPSLLRPAVNIAKKLVFYPYECLEQRASKALPFLALSPQLAERLELGLDQSQIRAAVDGYLKIIPEFMNAQGALSYYRGGQYPSDYLTAYVLWSLHLARGSDYKVDPQLVQKLSSYLQRASLDKTCEAFYQFVLSLGRGADGKKLKKLAAERDALPFPGKVFLYRALHNQGIGKDLLPSMLDEFNNSLQVEADFAYFDVGEFSYNRDFPFYSSRFATALLLQAVLEVEKGHVLAERIINWLLEGEPHCWNTTQTNFWVLCAMDEYLAQVEKKTASKAEVVMLGERAEKVFANSRDTLLVGKKLGESKEVVEVGVSADQPVYVTSELSYQLARAGKKSRGIDVRRIVYDESGKEAAGFKRGQVYQVELLVTADKEVPYGVIDEPLAAGFELLRQDIGTTRSLKEFNTKNQGLYWTPWVRQENAADRLVFYTYSMKGKMRFVYFIKAMYSGRFTWLPAVAQGMYHPQYFGRNELKTIEVGE